MNTLLKIKASAKCYNFKYKCTNNPAPLFASNNLYLQIKTGESLSLQRRTNFRPRQKTYINNKSKHVYFCTCRWTNSSITYTLQHQGHKSHIQDCLRASIIVWPLKSELLKAFGHYCPLLYIPLYALYDMGTSIDLAQDINTFIQLYTFSLLEY